MFPSSQQAFLNIRYAHAQDDTISGAWLIDYTVTAEKLEPLSLYALLDMRYTVRAGIPGVYRFVLRDADDNNIYRLTFTDGVMTGREYIGP